MTFQLSGKNVSSFLVFVKNPQALFQWLYQFYPVKYPKSSSGTLEVIDHRTGNHHRVGISDNAVLAQDFQSIPAGPGTGPALSANGGLRVLDPGFQNTAVMKSQVTFV